MIMSSTLSANCDVNSVLFNDGSTFYVGELKLANGLNIYAPNSTEFTNSLQTVLLDKTKSSS